VTRRSPSQVLSAVASLALAVSTADAAGQVSATDPKDDHLQPLENPYGPMYAITESRETRLAIEDLYERPYVVYSNVAEVAHSGGAHNRENEWVASVHATKFDNPLGHPHEWNPVSYEVTCTLLDPGLLSAIKWSRLDSKDVWSLDDATVKAIQVFRHDVPLPKDAAEAVRSAWLEALKRTRYRSEHPTVLDDDYLTDTASGPSGWPRMSGVADVALTPAMKMLEGVANKLHAYCSIPESDRTSAAEGIRREANAAAAYIKEHDPLKP